MFVRKIETYLICVQILEIVSSFILLEFFPSSGNERAN